MWEHPAAALGAPPRREAARGTARGRGAAHLSGDIAQNGDYDVGDARHRVRAGVLLAALMVSAAGDEIAVLAMVFRMAERGHSGMVAALLIAQIAPAVLLAPIVGHLIDRQEASRLLVVASILQGLLLFVVVADERISVLVAGMFGISAIGSVTTPAVLTLLPIIAGEAVPVRSNAAIEGGRALATLGGPLLGGFLIAATGTRTPLIIDAASFIVVAVVLPLLGVQRPVAKNNGRWWSGAGDGLRHLIRQRSLRPLMLVLPITTSAASMVNVAMVFIVRGPMHAGAAVLGVMTASWGAGAVLGAAGITRFKLSRPELTVTLGATVTGAALLVWGALPLIAVGFIAAILGGIGWSVHNISLRSAVQMHTPPRLHGRAHAGAGAVVNSFFLVGFAVSGVFAFHHAQAVFVIAGAITTVVAGLAAAALIAEPGQSSVGEPREVDLPESED
jgi:MFS family permease